jgi:predicted nucleotidyltransferase
MGRLLNPRRTNINRLEHHPSIEVNGIFVIRDAEKRIREIVARIVKRFDPVRIILFGSRARGSARPDSDADLLVVMPVRGSRRRTATEIDVALMGIQLPVDIIVVTPEDFARDRNSAGSIVNAALREGRVLHERAG